MHVFGVRLSEFSLTWKQYLKVDNFHNFSLPYMQRRKLHCTTHKHETIILPLKAWTPERTFPSHLLWKRAYAGNISCRKYLQWAIYASNSADKIKLSFILSTDAAP